MAEIVARPEQLKALEVFKAVIKDARGRRAFTTAQTPEEKEEVFNGKRGSGDLSDANYKELPDSARQLLEALSDSELALLSDLDNTFVRAGLRIDASPGGLMVH